MSSARVGRYRLLAELARGGMGIVHLAELDGPGGFRKLVVVKELKPELARDPVHRTMFLDEARLAARLEHRHVVETLEVACDGDRIFMALEHLSGVTLDDARKKGPIPRVLVLRILSAVLSALEHAQGATDDEGKPLGVVHRDVSAKNVFLCFDGNVKLLDFGVAKSASARQETRTGMVKGAVPYMSPDHLDKRPIDRRADLFAVGVLLRELVTGTRLWEGEDDLTILRRLIARDLPDLPASIPADLGSVIRRVMEPLREHRYFDAREMRRALEALAAPSDLELGAWLTKTFASERRAESARIRLARARHERPAPPPLPTPKEEWLPSSHLVSIPTPKRSKRPVWLAALVLASLATAGTVLAGARQHRQESASPARVMTTASLRAVTPLASKRAGEPEEAAEATASGEMDGAMRDDALTIPPIPPNPYE